MLGKAFSRMARIGSALALATAASAAPGDHEWSDGWSVQGAGIASDAAGAVASAGTFSGSVDFGGGALTATTSFDVYVAKLNNAGGHVWSANFPPTFYVVVTAVGSSPSGNTYVAGTLPKGGEIDFGGGPLGGDFGDCWAVGFDPDGNHLWSDEYGRGLIYDIDATDTEVVFAAKNIGSSTMNFGGGDLGSEANQAILVKLTADAGAHLWSDEYGDSDFQEGREVEILPGGDVFLLAATRGDIDFGGGALSSDSNYNLALAHFDTNGGHLWSDIYHGQFGTFSILSTGMDATSFGSVVITGDLVGTVDFGGGPLTSSGQDAFVARFDVSGNHVWSDVFGDTDEESGKDVAFDADNGVSVVGTFKSNNFDAGGGVLSLVGTRDLFVLSLDTGGAHQWSRAFGSSGSESQAGVETDANNGTLFDVTGGGSIDFGGGAIAGTYDIVKLGGAEVVATPPAGDALSWSMRAWPNPFHAETTLRLTGNADFAGTLGDGATVSVFDVSGRRVKRFDLAGGAGVDAITWDGRTDAGHAVVPGVYFVRLDTPEASEALRVVRVR